MSYWTGFAVGAVAGALLTFIATGHIVIMEYTELFRNTTLSILFAIFITGWFITFYHAKYGEPCFGTTTDGLTVGISFVEAIIILLLYGFRL